MPIIEMKILEGRDQEVKDELIERVTQTVSETLQVSPESIRVLLYDIPLTHWGIAGKTVEKIRS
ncbi:tautomerase family protein [Paenibacillus aceris]|uniref:Tautomerase n=1 Tax=Paenibacillus aceris TaxID=869555 RepID=A0ABS4I390_9BACL|nr:2-hydroxymuconate tautomerase family protein [Paenibacillus aceris]MBP1965006.1 4-oxalocrotonate tautomerase [Paenibacillus aceris]NHW35666.1 2-hydroxymuconate tautomerase family protein [Paenibacillus aceris]